MDVYLDISDLYYRVKKRYNKKLNYKRLLDSLGQVNKARAYGCQVNDEARGFIAHLSSIGIKVYYTKPRVFTVGDREIKNCNWLVDITISAICTKEKHVVFCSSNIDLIPLFKHLQLMGIKVTVVSCGIPGAIKAIVDEWKEIGEELCD